MLEIVKTLENKRATNTREMTLVLVRCSRCDLLSVTTIQNVKKHQALGRKFCRHCATLTERHHGLSRSRIYGVWNGMKDRCCNPKSRDRKNYGGRGIRLSEEWETFENFFADMGSTYRKGFTIERIDVNGDYSKENCTWVTPMAQQANKRTNLVLRYLGQNYHLAELCRLTGLSKSKLRSRLAKGMTAEMAVEHAQRSLYGTGRHATGARMATMKRVERQLKAARNVTSTTSLTAALDTDS